MQRKIRKIHIAALLCGILAILWLLRTCGAKHELQWLDKDGKPLRGRDAESRAHARTSDPALIGFLNAFERRIDLYGKVVDQHGKGVEGATITIYAHDKPFRDGGPPAATLLSDASGGFSILGLKGFQLAVDANKRGYIDYSPLGGPQSTASVSPGNHDKPEKPLILTIHDPGPMEPLVHVAKSRRKLPLDGTLRKIALDTVDGRKGTHVMECKFQSEYHQLPEEKLYGHQYNWSFEARIPGGGFVRNENDLKMGTTYQFEAPADGYQEVIRYDFPSSLPKEEWKSFLSDSFFVRFPDGTHGRIRFNLEGFASSNPLYMETWWNPKPGSRNLSSLSK